MAIEKLEKINGTCQLINAVDNPIPFWAPSHRDLGCPWATLPILDFRIPGGTGTSRELSEILLVSHEDYFLRAFKKGAGTIASVSWHSLPFYLQAHPMTQCHECDLVYSSRHMSSAVVHVVC
jgi:hypothetical protein